MTEIPVRFEDLLWRIGLIDDIYNAMMNPDLSVVVMKVLDALHKTNILPAELVKECKTEDMSTEFRNKGNCAYARNYYHLALICYNRALLHAPKGSRALKLAYSNRSALLHKVNAYEACLKDIDICFSLGCPYDIIEKLRTRKEVARSNLWVERLSQNLVRNEFSEAYFQIIGGRNPQIPCASMDVGVLVENEVPKIVATTDIKVGTVIAVETAFISRNALANAFYTCYYCQKIHLNLIPCEGCCYVLFCDETCRQKCLKEYHGIECQIIESDNFTHNVSLRMSLNALLKMKQRCQSWSELIAASHDLGLSRIKSSSINEIYDTNSTFSLLNIKDERHFLHGPMYNTSVYCAFVVYYLEKVPGFYPRMPEERNEAKHAFARLLMFLSLYTRNTLLVPVATVKKRNNTDCSDNPNYGWFSFLGKFKKSCNANVLVVGLNNKIGLVAQQPIKRGTELSVSSVGHWLECSGREHMSQSHIFALCGTVCNCNFCKRDSFNTTMIDELTDMQKRRFRELNILEMHKRLNTGNLSETYSRLCKMLAILCNVPFSNEYAAVYKLFRECILFAQNMTTQNCILDYQ